MKLHVLGSSSKGNCYILENGVEALIIEAGIPFKDIKKALGFNLRKVVGCLVTHRHGDHSKSVSDLVSSGITTLAIDDVWGSINAKSTIHRITIRPNKGYVVGRFKVFVFLARHDVPCVGFLITHEEMGRMMFLTDSYTCHYRFGGLNHILIECNYSDRSLSQAILDGRTFSGQRERLSASHMELSDCKDILRTTDLSTVSEIVLIHLSENNSDEGYFVSEIERQTGRAVYVAKQGLTLDMSLV